ncbi:MAG: FHA domain-containing protein [Anaeromyxobacter sp.]
MKCTRCGAALSSGVETCPACGTEVELGRLTGILGIVCRSCDAYNDPGARSCVACGKPLGRTTPPPVVRPPAGGTADAAPPAPPAAPAPAPEPPPAAAPAAPPPASDGPVVRSFARGAPPAARVVPPTALRAPMPLARCPRCGGEPGVGSTCVSCGQVLGSSGTQVMVPLGAELPAAAPRSYGALSPGRAHLVLERGAGDEGAHFPLAGEATPIGRAGLGLSFPDDPTLAPLHATLIFREGALHVRDEGAPGGIFLKLRGLSIPLRPGDQFVVGDTLLRLAGPLPPGDGPTPDGTLRLGAPRAPGAVAIEELLEGGAAGRVFVRTGPSIRIGRAGCSVNLGDDPYLSQAHAELQLDGEGRARLRDLGSSNGTFVRLPARAERALRDADVLRIGREALRVKLNEDG